MEDTSNAKDAPPFLAMLAVECIKMSASTLSKAAMASGLSRYVYIVYYDALGTLIFLPYFVYRCIRGRTLPITLPLLCKFFGLSLLGKCLFPILYYAGLGYSSVTLGAAIGNLSPIFTYLLAVAFSMEKLDLRKFKDQLKALGTIVAVVGALVVTLYKGPVLLRTLSSSNSPHILLNEQPSWAVGGLFFTLAFIIVSTNNIFQADAAKLYPDEISLVFFYTFFGTIQTAIAAIFMVEEPSAWSLHHKIQVIAIIQEAFAISVVSNTLMTWCLRKKGAVYVSMFTPLNIGIAAFLGFVFLGDGIYIGSVIGSATIVVGFYAVMWAQAKTLNVAVKSGGESESGFEQVTPLLQSMNC